MQGEGSFMPDGPLIISPDRSASSMYREMIIKKPHIFKIKCLKEIKNAFPFDIQPFYAGFGNRYTDYITFRALSISEDKIYIINPKGLIIQFDKVVYKNSYV